MNTGRRLPQLESDMQRWRANRSQRRAAQRKVVEDYVAGKPRPIPPTPPAPAWSETVEKLLLLDDLLRDLAAHRDAAEPEFVDDFEDQWKSVDEMRQAIRGSAKDCELIEYENAREAAAE